MNLKKIIGVNILLILWCYVLYSHIVPSVMHPETFGRSIGYTLVGLVLTLVLVCIVVSCLFIFGSPELQAKILHTERQLKLKPAGEKVRSTVLVPTLRCLGGPVIELVEQKKEESAEVQTT